jgi:hypothetical protein
VGSLAVRYQQIDDAAPPHILVEEAAWFVASICLPDTELQLCVLLTWKLR